MGQLQRSAGKGRPIHFFNSGLRHPIDAGSLSDDGGPGARLRKGRRENNPNTPIIGNVRLML